MSTAWSRVGIHTISNKQKSSLWLLYSLSCKKSHACNPVLPLKLIIPYFVFVHANSSKFAFVKQFWENTLRQKIRHHRLMIDLSQRHLNLYFQFLVKIRVCKHMLIWWHVEKKNMETDLPSGCVIQICLNIFPWGIRNLGHFIIKWKIQGGVYGNRLIFHPQCDLLSLTACRNVDHASELYG